MATDATTEYVFNKLLSEHDAAVKLAEDKAALERQVENLNRLLNAEVTYGNELYKKFNQAEKDLKASQEAAQNAQRNAAAWEQSARDLAEVNNVLVAKISALQIDLDSVSAAYLVSEFNLAIPRM